MTDAAIGDHLQRQVNYYVPNMKYAVDAVHGNVVQINLGAPSAEGTGQIITTVSSTTTPITDFSTGSVGGTCDAPYGRTIRMVLGAAGTPTVTIQGKDYLGQPMTETLTGNGTTAVEGQKAFYWIDSITMSAATGTNISVGWNDECGLPFKADAINHEIADGQQVAVTESNLVAPDTTYPATATTNDTRGTYNPTTALDGSAVIEVGFICSNESTADSDGIDRGGLFGVPQYSA